MLLSALCALGAEGFAQGVGTTGRQPVGVPLLTSQQSDSTGADNRREDAPDADLLADLNGDAIQAQAITAQRNLDGDLRAQAAANGRLRDGDLSREGRIDDGRPDVRLPENFDLLPRVTPRSLRSVRRRLAREARPDVGDRYGAEFEPQGIRAGAFILRPSLTGEVVTTDNIFLTDQATHSDEALQFRGRIDATSDWSRHALSLSASGLANAHRTFESENETAYELRLRGRLDVTRRTAVELETFSLFGQESRGSVEFGGAVGEDRPDQRQDGIALSLRHRFNRLEATVSGAVTDQRFDGGGRDYLDSVVSLRGRYALNDALSLIGDVSWIDRAYDAVVAGDLDRSSSGVELRGGVAFDNGSKLRGVVLAGYRTQRSDDAVLDDVSGFVVDGVLDWQMSALTALQVLARSQIDGTTFGLASGVRDHELGATVSHSLRRNLQLRAGVTGIWRDYVGISLDEREVAAFIDGEWLLTNRFALQARLEHRDFTSSDTGRDYSENRARVGVRLQR